MLRVAPSDNFYPTTTYSSVTSAMSTTVSSLETNVSLTSHLMRSFWTMDSTANPSSSKRNPTKSFLASCLRPNHWNLSINYQGPTNVSQVLSPFSASPPKVLLSGFRSRCHIVTKGAFPEFRVRQGLDQLIHLYTRAGFPKEELYAISNQIMIQHQNLQPPEANRSCPSLTLISFIFGSGFRFSFFFLSLFLFSFFFLSFFLSLLCWCVFLVVRFSFFCFIPPLIFHCLVIWLKFVFLQLLFGHRDHGLPSRPRISQSPGSGYHAFELPGRPFAIL